MYVIHDMSKCTKLHTALWVCLFFVTAAPILLNKANDSTHVTLNKNITITVDITADPDPVATWKLNGGDLGAMTTTSLT